MPFFIFQKELRKQGQERPFKNVMWTIVNNILINIALERKRQVIKTMLKHLLHTYCVPGTELIV